MCLQSKRYECQIKCTAENISEQESKKIDLSIACLRALEGLHLHLAQGQHHITYRAGCRDKLLTLARVRDTHNLVFYSNVATSRDDEILALALAL